MAVRRAGEQDLVAAKVVLKAFGSMGSFQELPKRAEKVLERFPSWRLAWVSLDKDHVKLLVEVPLHTPGSSPWREVPYLQEAYVLSPQESEEDL